jgi:SET domain-containing protein
MHSENTRRRTRTARPPAAVEVQRSTIHGWGVFAIADLEAGQNVGRYAGRRYPAGANRPDWDGKVTYLFLLSDGTLIDGARGGNFTRHINHACRPNVEAVEVLDARGVLGIEVRTKRRIRRGEELVLDYALDIPDGDPSDYRCLCGGNKCRGSLAAS